MHNIHTIELYNNNFSFTVAKVLKDIFSKFQVDLREADSKHWLCKTGIWKFFISNFFLKISFSSSLNSGDAV